MSTKRKVGGHGKARPARPKAKGRRVPVVTLSNECDFLSTLERRPSLYAVLRGLLGEHGKAALVNLIEVASVLTDDEFAEATEAAYAAYRFRHKGRNMRRLT